VDDDAVDASAVLAVALRALRGDGRVDGRWLVTERVPHPDGRRRIGLVRDAATDIWLAGAVRPPGGRLPWKALLDSAVAASGREPEGVAGVWPRNATAPPPEGAAAVERLRSAGPDVAWLAPDDDDELAMGLAARAALRELAGRLPGFGRSSMQYLVERFLPPGGIVAATTERIHAELPAPPLEVILVMAGLDTFSYRVPWLEQEVVVTHRGG
jgi:hypothetical protein